MSTRKRPEVLAPAGDSACLEAAVRAGADAVYFGLQGHNGFNARARATNFDTDGLAAVVRGLHERGVRAYVTLNTLVFDAELAAMESAVRACAAAGVDAVIVQDLGVAQLVRAVAPGLPFHASTQMTCTDASGVELAREAGAARVILARELSLDDIAQIRAGTDAELEVFVHGALCISYSGQCLTSEAIGGRSANRGACAQACRLPYGLVVDGVARETGDAAFLLSPEDLEASALVPRLIELGVTSLKIEGRLKGPEYVAATTALYRRAVDAALGEGRAPTEEERQVALQAYSRGSGPGFLAGVDHQRLVEGRSCDHRGLPVGSLSSTRPRTRDASARGRAELVLGLDAELARGDGVLVEGGLAGEGEHGGRVWAITVGGRDVERAFPGDEALVWLGPERALPVLVPGRRVWKTSDPARQRAAQKEARAPRRVRIDVEVRGTTGTAPVFSAKSAHGHAATVSGDLPIGRATGRGLDRAMLIDKLGKLGETPFELGELTIDLPADAMIPPSSLNRARRALVATLSSSAPQDGSRATTSVTAAELLARAATPDRPRRAPAAGGLFALCRSVGQAEAALDAGVDGVYLDFLELTGTGNAVRALRQRGAKFVGVAPPRIRKPGEEKIDRFLASLAPDAVLVRALGPLREQSTAPTGATVSIGDFSLNVTNHLTAAELLGRGLAAFTPSFDLDGSQLVALLDAPLAPFAEVVVHHPMALFHMEHCVIAALLSDGKDFKSCGRPCERHAVSLRDRAGLEHPVEADVGCRNTVFHGKPQSAVDLVPALQLRGVRRFRIELVREDAAEVARVVGIYRRLVDGAAEPREAWRALRAESGYGVVRGSLRVIDNT